MSRMIRVGEKSFNGYEHNVLFQNLGARHATDSGDADKSDYIDVQPPPLPDEHTEEILREYGVGAPVDEPAVATPAGD